MGGGWVGGLGAGLGTGADCMWFLFWRVWVGRGDIGVGRFGTVLGREGLGMVDEAFALRYLWLLGALAMA
jgi:hypothetical protein